MTCSCRRARSVVQSHFWQRRVCRCISTALSQRQHLPRLVLMHSLLVLTAILPYHSCRSSSGCLSQYQSNTLPRVDPFLLNDNADLQTVCTSTCTQSLVSYRSNVVSACGSFTIKSNNVTYPPTYAVDKILGAYTVQCLQDPTTHAFCGPAFAALNATGGLLVSPLSADAVDFVLMSRQSLPTSQLCTFCTLKTLNATLSNPATYSAPLAATLKSAITTCGS